MALLFHAFSIPRHWYIFDANTNCVFSVNKEQYKALSEIENGVETPKNLTILKQFQDKGFCLDVNIEKIENPDGELIYAHLNKKIQQCTLQITQECNLRCDYCAYSGIYSNRMHSPKTMSFETAKRIINFVLARSGDTYKLAFGFYGGEPLLELNLIKKCVTYIKMQAPEREIFFTITTNGTLLVPEIYDYLINNSFNIIISLDGPKQVHDASRKFPDGSGSYDIIMSNIRKIQKQYPDVSDKVNFIAVINPEIEEESCLQNLFKSNDIIPFYNLLSSFVNDLYSENETTYSDSFTLVYNREHCKYLLHLLGKLSKKNISPLMNGLDAQYKDQYKQLARINKMPSVCHPGGPCIAGALRLFADVNGNFFPCERVSESSKLMKIGDVNNGFDYEQVRLIMNPGKVTEEQCKVCWAFARCNLCAAFCDDLSELSKKMRLSRCVRVRFQTENTLKTICFLKESGYSFEQ